MGTVRLPDNLPTIHKKFIVEAFARIWQEFEEPTAPHIYVTVMNEDGTPVTDLEINNFHVGYFDNQPTGWWEFKKVIELQKIRVSDGIYRLALDGFLSSYYQDMVFSVEAFNQELSGINKILYRGQSLAYLQPKNAMML